MDFETIYEWVIFPLIIFLSRTCDVSLGTLRNVLASKGKKNIVPFIGFFEVLLWLIAISFILKNLNNIMCYIGWASGYATGIYLGLSIEEKLAIGTQVIRIITTNNQTEEFSEQLSNNGFGYTCQDAQGSRGPVKMIFTVVERKKIKEVIEIIHQYLPQSFYSIEDIRHSTQNGYTFNEKKNLLNALLSFKKRT
jgi:uncharacterized protein YebE (UPF0316 family)